MTVQEDPAHSNDTGQAQEPPGTNKRNNIHLDVDGFILRREPEQVKWIILDPETLGVKGHGIGSADEAFARCKGNQVIFVIVREKQQDEPARDDLAIVRWVGFKVPKNVAKKTDGTFDTLASYVRKKNPRAILCAISRGSEYDYKQLQHDYNISTSPIHQDRPLAGTDHIFATDFSGMDCMGYILGKLRSDAAPRHLWTCDILKCSRDFTVNNFVALNTYTDVENRPLPSPGMLHTYVAGPPCQGLSNAGRRKGWDDPRTRLYMQSFFAIEETRPKASLKIRTNFKPRATERPPKRSSRGSKASNIQCMPK